MQMLFRNNTRTMTFSVAKIYRNRWPFCPISARVTAFQLGSAAERLLLFGPPGAGKSFIAHKIAIDADVTFTEMEALSENQLRFTKGRTLKTEKSEASIELQNVEKTDGFLFIGTSLKLFEDDFINRLLHIPLPFEPRRKALIRLFLFIHWTQTVGLTEGELQLLSEHFCGFSANDLNAMVNRARLNAMDNGEVLGYEHFDQTINALLCGEE
ncbi:hypothetical protein niasHT_039808 [Heterodera trifolii]|uniref:ATPase AAA-type core domain-containing protein n=1 Tax=Heterodera trifolii TaxID=157864 RepID=A0ABD2IQ35_9BILA